MCVGLLCLCYWGEWAGRRWHRLDVLVKLGQEVMMEIRGDYGTFKDFYLGTIFSTVLGLSRFLFLLTISPAWINVCTHFDVPASTSVDLNILIWVDPSNSAAPRLLHLLLRSSPFLPGRHLCRGFPTGLSLKDKHEMKYRKVSIWIYFYLYLLCPTSNNYIITCWRRIFHIRCCCLGRCGGMFLCRCVRWCVHCVPH